eukprot:365904-Chlamydomonas_euryale.AAC.5
MDGNNGTNKINKTRGWKQQRKLQEQARKQPRMYSQRHQNAVFVACCKRFRYNFARCAWHCLITCQTSLAGSLASLPTLALMPNVPLGHVVGQRARTLLTWAPDLHEEDLY